MKWRDVGTWVPGPRFAEKEQKSILAQYVFYRFNCELGTRLRAVATMGATLWIKYIYPRKLFSPSLFTCSNLRDNLSEVYQGFLQRERLNAVSRVRKPCESRTRHRRELDMRVLMMDPEPS